VHEFPDRAKLPQIDCVDEGDHKMADEKVRIIETVRTPLAFFVLIVLMVEIIFGIAAGKFPSQQKVIIYAMIILIFLLVGIVAFLSYLKPEALRGVRYSEDPELTRIRQNFQEIEHLANMIVGDWTFITRYQPESQQQRVEVRGFCEIKKGKYGISMHGNCIDQDGNSSTPFVVKQVFMNEEGLTFIYEVPQDLGRATLGVGQVRFGPAERESLIGQMRGNWGVLGSKVFGEAKFDRKK
jgi:hypothetical protein